MKIIAVIALIAAVFFAYLILTGVNKFLQAQRQTSWPKVEATITSFEKERTRSTIEDGEFYSLAGEYSYVVDGSTYQSTSVSMDAKGEFSEGQVVQRFGSMSPKTVDIYYDPNAPGNAVIFTGNPKVFLFLMGMGTFMMLAAGFIAYRGFTVA